MRCWRHRLLGPALGLAALVASALAHAGATPTGAELADLEAQSDYAFYTHDARLSARVLDGASALAGSRDRLARLQYGHAAFRRVQLAELLGEHAEVVRVGEACLDALRGDVRHGAADPEALALAIGCAGYVALEGGLRGRMLAGRIDEWIAEAGPALAAHPRLRLSRALALWYRTDAGPERVPRARAEFDAIARALDAVAATEPGEPTWGAADAWFYAGQAAVAAGDAVAARNDYEHALLVAPQCGAARRALDSLLAAH